MTRSKKKKKDTLWYSLSSKSIVHIILLCLLFTRTLLSDLYDLMKEVHTFPDPSISSTRVIPCCQ